MKALKFCFGVILFGHSSQSFNLLIRHRILPRRNFNDCRMSALWTPHRLSRPPGGAVLRCCCSITSSRMICPKRRRPPSFVGKSSRNWRPKIPRQPTQGDRLGREAGGGEFVESLAGGTVPTLFCRRNRSVARDGGFEGYQDTFIGTLNNILAWRMFSTAPARSRWSRLRAAPVPSTKRSSHNELAAGPHAGRPKSALA